MAITEQRVETERQLRPGQTAVDVLRANGVDVVFGLNGEHVLGLYDALAAAPDIRHVVVKHENNAAIAAEAYGRLTGRPGVVTVTAGPGATNSLSGVAGAMASGAPLVHLSGGVPLGAEIESFHGVDDPEVLERAFAGATKWSVRVTDPRQVAAALTRAFALAVAGRPGPVHVELARNVLDSGPLPAPAVSSAPTPPAAAPADLAWLVDQLDAARQVVIVAGKGAWYPAVSAALPALAEALGAPMLHTWDGHAAVPTAHPLYLGMLRGEASQPEALAALQAADLVLAVGVRAGTEAARDLPRRSAGPVVCLMAGDPLPAPAGPTLPSTAALAATLRALTAGVRPRRASDTVLETCARTRTALQAALAAELRRYAQARPWHIGHAIQALAERMTADHVVTSDVSTVKLWMPLQLPVFGPESHVQAGTWGAMGYALPAAIGAAFARPGRKVIAMTGDTSFLMASSDFVTLCQQRLPVVVAIHHDGHIGMIYQMQVTRGEPAYATEIGDVDFARYAAACGARGIRVEDPADLGAAWDQALAADGPVVLDLIAGHEPPWPRLPRLLAEA